MSEVNYVCDVCGQDFSSMDDVTTHLKEAHDLEDVGPIGSITQADGMLILKQGDGEKTVIDLAEWLKEELGPPPTKGWCPACGEGKLFTVPEDVGGGTRCNHCNSYFPQWPEPTTPQPNLAQLDGWQAEGGCQATDGCWVETDGGCIHGHPSWLLRLGLI